MITESLSTINKNINGHSFGFELHWKNKVFTPDEMEQIENIFFLSSNKKSFSDLDEKKRFFMNWTQFYFLSSDSQILLARNSESKIIAYLMANTNSFAALSFFDDKVSSFRLFQDLFEFFPAHLHINALPGYRGFGIGSRLIQQYVSFLKQQKVNGLHLVTSPNSRNVTFYRKNNFSFNEIRSLSSIDYLFMGQVL